MEVPRTNEDEFGLQFADFCDQVIACADGFLIQMINPEIWSNAT